MTDVDPIIGLVGLTGPISSLEELIERYKRLEWIVFQLRERTGGSSDTIENIINTESYETSVSSGEYHSFNEEIRTLDDDSFVYDSYEPDEDLIIHEQPSINEPEYTSRVEWNPVSKNVNYTAIDHDFVEATNKVTIKLDSKSETGSHIEVGNGDGSEITIDGDGVELRYAGRRGSTIKIKREGTFIHWYRFDDGDTSYWRGG